MESIDNHKSASKVEEVSQLRTELTELRTELTELRKEFTTENLKLRTEVTDLRTENTALRSKNSDLRPDNEVRIHSRYPHWYPHQVNLEQKSMTNISFRSPTLPMQGPSQQVSKADTTYRVCHLQGKNRITVPLRHATSHHGCSLLYTNKITQNLVQNEYLFVN